MAVHELQSFNTGIDAKCVFLDGQFHVIGGLKSKKHYIWNNGSFETLHERNGFAHYSQICHIQSKGIVLLFNEKDSESQQILVEHYDSISNVWTSLYVKLPIDEQQQRMNFGITTALNDKFIVFFGGYNQSNSTYSDEIFMFELSTHKFMISKLKCPTAGLYRAIAVSNQEMDAILVNGYVRMYCLLSDDLLNLLQLLYSSEMIYLLDINGKGPCIICDYTSTSKWKWENHIKSKRHQKERLKLLKQKVCPVWTESHREIMKK